MVNKKNNTSFKYEKYETAWCPGCGNFAILESLKTSLEELGLSPHEVVVAGGIGQAAKTAQYLNANGFEGLHGRALPAATAIKIANNKLKVILSTGDGDSYGEGGNHFIHGIRRNVDISHFVHNNQIYGLTKGQSSPTSDYGHVTDFTPEGVKTMALNPVLTAIAVGAGFVARAFSGDPKSLVEIMKQAIEYNGYALVDILQPCVSFNKLNTFAWYKKRVYSIVEEDKDYDPSDRMKALEKAEQWGERIPLGVIYKKEKQSFADRLPFLKEEALYDRTTDKEIIKKLAEEFSA